LFNLAILISGSGSNQQAVMDAVENGTIPRTVIRLVISDREGAYGLERAKKRNIPNMVIGKNDISKLLKVLKSKKIDGIVLAGYLSIMPPEVVNKYSGKIINIHPALLPKFGGKGFYGIKVHNAVIASGAKYTGATAHLVDTGIDTGAALVRGLVPVLNEDTAESLQKKVLAIEYDVLVHAVKGMAENRIKSLVEKPMLLIEEREWLGVLGKLES